MALSVDIKKTLGDFKLDIRFEAENEILALLGASGCGKSMTLKCIAGIEKPDEGRIVLDGQVLFDSEKKINLSPQKRRTGYLFQNYALFPHMTVEENIGIGAAGGRRGKDSAVRQMVQAFYLDGLEKRYPSQLSGGQQQRVALARILASEPKMLMLDEPFSALDSYLRWQLEQDMSILLEEFAGTTLYVSHNRDEVYRLCGRIAVLSNGAIDVMGDKWQLFSAPQTFSAALLTGCKNISKADKLSEYTLLAKDWGVVYQTAESVPDDLRYIGIRAHHFSPAGDGAVPNTYECGIVRVVQDTFSTIVMFRYQDGRMNNSLIRWETNKETYSRLDHGRVTLSVHPKDILLMTK